MEKTTRIFIYLILLSGIVLSGGCYERITDPAPADTNTISKEFDFSTKKSVNISLSTGSEHFTARPGIKLSFYDDDPFTGGKLIARVMTDAEGFVNIPLSISASRDGVYVRSEAIGLPNDIRIPLSGNYWSGNFETALGVNASVLRKTSNGPDLNLRTLGSWDNLGVPEYLDATRENITPSLMQKIETSLPEYLALTTTNPEYLSSTNATTTEVTELSEVTVSFVHEGAGFKNVFGFYDYDKNNPPQSIDDIKDSLTVIFPNASYFNSGGGLYMGDRIFRLGVFPANTVIGWFIVADGFNNGSINPGQGLFYSNPNLNPESSPSKRQHNVILKDPDTGQLIIGFEDMNRDLPECDNDFNDILFTVKVAPTTAAPTTNVPPLENPVQQEQYLNTYLPANNTFGTLIFEDLWPSLGDYDFNDLVVDYNFTLTSNSSNMVTEMNALIRLKAIGGGMHNGFAFELPVPASSVASVSGSILKNGYISVNGNGTEAGQSKAVIVVFDDAYDIMYPAGGSYVNTEQDYPKINSVDIPVKIVFSTPQPLISLLNAPYNPFIIVNKERGREIHLVDKAPTAKADLNLFGTMDDVSNPSAGKYYRNKNNLVWALDVANTFKHTVEHSPIWDGYLYFYDWASSNGMNHSDWFQDKEGNVNRNKIYNKP